MMFSTRAEYGVRVMIELGRRREKGPVPLAEVAASERLPLGYLEHLVARLREAGLVRSTRGAHGGYELERSPAEITMAEVVSALEGTVVPMQCFTEPGEMRVLCNHELDGFEHCATRLLWTRVQGGVIRALEQTTLAELVAFADRRGTPKQGKPTVKRLARGRASEARPTTVNVTTRT
jgi:Rrf2 family transcriptional regulator, cysteine metabolism repressor